MWHDQNGPEVKILKFFSSCHPNGGHVHMSNWPRNCGLVDFIARIYGSLVHIRVVGFLLFYKTTSVDTDAGNAQK